MAYLPATLSLLSILLYLLLSMSLSSALTPFNFFNAKRTGHCEDSLYCDFMEKVLALIHKLQNPPQEECDHRRLLLTPPHNSGTFCHYHWRGFSFYLSLTYTHLHSTNLGSGFHVLQTALEEAICSDRILILDTRSEWTWWPLDQPTRGVPPTSPHYMLTPF